jgi:hypothetical protein
MKSKGKKNIKKIDSATLFGKDYVSIYVTEIFWVKGFGSDTFLYKEIVS